MRTLVSIILAVLIITTLGMVTANEVGAVNPIAGFWHLNDNANDSSGNSNNGSLIGSTTTYINSMPNFGKAVMCAPDAGGNVGFVMIPDSPSLDITNELTIGAWVNLPNHSGSVSNIVGKTGPGVGQRSYMLAVVPESAPPGAPTPPTSTVGKAQFTIWYDDSTSPPIVSSLIGQTVLTPGKWYQLVGTYKFVADGTSQMRLYVNGKLDGTIDTARGPIMSGSGDVTIGRRAGKFDEIYIMNMASPIISVTADASLGNVPGYSESLTVPMAWETTNPTASGTYPTGFSIPSALTGGVKITAPLTVTRGSTTYDFKNWLVNYTPQMPPGNPVLNLVSVDGSKDVKAIYAPRLILSPLTPTVNPVGNQVTLRLITGVNQPNMNAMFTIERPPSTPTTHKILTASDGSAEFSYIGDTNGQDSIWAWIDYDGNGVYDPSPTARPSEISTINSKLSLSWVVNFLTSGGNLKDEKGKVVWTFSGTAGVLPEGGAVGVFDLFDKKTGYSYHLDSFTWLVFQGSETGSPSAVRNIARFRATGTCSNGILTTPAEIVVMLWDVDEPGNGFDKIAAVQTQPTVIPLIGSFPVPENMSFSQNWKTIQGGNIQIHNLN
jgi:hypothetical protein